MSKKTWVVTTHKDWNKITFYELGIKNRIKGSIGSIWESVDTSLGHLFCTGSIGKSEILWKVSAGKPKYDFDYLVEDGRPFLENSVAHYLLKFNNSILDWATSTLDEDLLTEIEISNEELIQLAPDLDFILDENR